jgi:hypothetical protein
LKSEKSSARKFLVLPQFDLNKALCGQTDPEVFFPEKGGATQVAINICNMCEVRLDCLSWALTNDEKYGIWGGLTANERERLQKQRGTKGTRRVRKPITIRNTKEVN